MAVHYAVQSGNSDLLNWLLKDLGMHAAARDSMGRTSTHVAALTGSLHMLQCLHLNKQLSFSSDDNQSAPLHLAAFHGSVDCVQVLLSAGHPTVVTDSHGCSPLHVACLEQHLLVVDLLAQTGRVDEYDSTGASPLMVCVSKGMEDGIKTLLKYGARATHRDYSGSSCLHALLNLPHEKPEQLALQQRITMMLIKQGIDVNARDNSGRSPCHVASEKGNIEMLKLLIDHGGDVSVVDAAGKTCMAQLNREHFQVVTNILIDRIIPLSHQQVQSAIVPRLSVIVRITLLSAFSARFNRQWESFVRQHYIISFSML
jgi:ankyrin repeat protein